MNVKTFLVTYANQVQEKFYSELEHAEAVANSLFGNTLEGIRSAGADIVEIIEKELGDGHKELDSGGDQTAGGTAQGVGSANEQEDSAGQTQQGSESTGEIGTESSTGGNA